MSKYEIVSDGEKFRIIEVRMGQNNDFVRDYDTGLPVEFNTKRSAEDYIDRRLTITQKWQRV